MLATTSTSEWIGVRRGILDETWMWKGTIIAKLYPVGAHLTEDWGWDDSYVLAGFLQVIKVLPVLADGDEGLDGAPMIRRSERGWRIEHGHQAGGGREFVDSIPHVVPGHLAIQVATHCASEGCRQPLVRGLGICERYPYPGCHPMVGRDVGVDNMRYGFGVVNLGLHP